MHGQQVTVWRLWILQILRGGVWYTGSKTLHTSSELNTSKGNEPSYKNFICSFIDLLTTVHFFSVLTAFATYFGVIQRDWQVLPLFIFLWEMLTGSGAQCTNQNFSLLSWSQHGRQLDLMIYVFLLTFPSSSWISLSLLVTVSQPFSRKIDKIHRGRRSQYHRLNCLSLVCSQEINGANQHPYYVKLAEST